LLSKFVPLYHPNVILPIIPNPSLIIQVVTAAVAVAFGSSVAVVVSPVTVYGRHLQRS